MTDDTYYVARRQSKIYHSEQDCPHLLKADDRSEYATPPDSYRECLVCRHGSAYDAGKPAERDTCRSCEGTLDDDGECPFCRRFEAVVEG